MHVCVYIYIQLYTYLQPLRAHGIAVASSRIASPVVMVALGNTGETIGVPASPGSKCRLSPTHLRLNIPS